MDEWRRDTLLYSAQQRHWHWCGWTVCGWLFYCFRVLGLSSFDRPWFVLLEWKTHSKVRGFICKSRIFIWRQGALVNLHHWHNRMRIVMGPKKDIHIVCRLTLKYIFCILYLLISQCFSGQNCHGKSCHCRINPQESTSSIIPLPPDESKNSERNGPGPYYKALIAKTLQETEEIGEWIKLRMCRRSSYYSFLFNVSYVSFHCKRKDKPGYTSEDVV